MRGLFLRIPIDFDMSKLEADGLMKMRIWSFMRRLKGWNQAESGLTWGRDSDDPFRVRYQFDRRMDSEFRPEIRLFYSIEDMQEEISYFIYLDETPCHLGGVRYWFLCPLSRGQKACGRRVGVLYFNGKYFGCRHCLRLTYMSKSINYSANGSIRALDLVLRTQDLEGRIKRRTWRGKDTRQMRRLKGLYKRIGFSQ